MRDYIAWHDAYDDPGTPLSRRLRVVIDLIGAALDATPPGPCRFVSLCAGQGNDVLAAAAGHPRGRDLTGRLVELDPVNAGVAAARIEELGFTGLEVRTADAGNTDAYDGAVPADLVVACGIFGNVSLEDIEHTIRAFPSLCAPGAWVVWTRHPREPGVLERIEEWFGSAGFDQHALVVDPEQYFAVGLHRLTGDLAPFTPGQPLFTFVR
jgi:hypothetical protein